MLSFSCKPLPMRLTPKQDARAAKAQPLVCRPLAGCSTSPCSAAFKCRAESSRV